MDQGQIAVRIYRAFKEAGHIWHIDEGTPPHFTTFQSEMAYLAQTMANDALSDLTDNPTAINAGAWMAVELAGWTVGSTLDEDTTVVATHATGLAIELGCVVAKVKQQSAKKCTEDIRYAALALTELENAHMREYPNSKFWEHVGEQMHITEEDVYYQVVRRMLSKSDRRPSSIPAWRQFISQVIKNGK